MSLSPTDVALARAIARRRREMNGGVGISQAVAAGRAGTTLRTWQRWEAGEGAAFSRLEEIATALEVTPGAILADALPDPSAADGGAAIRELLERVRRIEDRGEL